MSASPYSEDIEAMIRSVTVKSPVDVMLFLGAGASVASGVPSAWQCIWQFKQRLFLSAHPTLDPSLVSDVGDPRVQARIQKWLDARPGTPKSGSSEEYGYYVEQCYPRGEDRRRFFESICEIERPSLGYRALGRMLERNHFRWLWTTNFDNLVPRGRPEAAKRPLREVGLDSTARLQFLTERDRYANFIHLHGDYRYDALRNTSAEVRSLDAEFISAIERLVRDLPLVVIGYGGHDESIMSALRTAYGTRGNGALYWTTLRDRPHSKSVQDLIELAAKNGHHARIVETDGFDDLMLRLTQFLLPKEEHAAFVTEFHANALRPTSPFVLNGYPGVIGVAKSNLWDVTLPDGYWSCECPEITSWKQLREKVGDAPIVTGLHKRVIALGSPSVFARVFGVSRDAITHVKFEPGDLESDTVVQGMLAEYAARALAGTAFCYDHIYGGWSLYDPRTAVSATRNEDYKIARSVIISIHFKDHAPILSLVPDRQIIGPSEDADPPEAVRAQVQRELSRQWNKAFNDELSEWRQALGLVATDRPLALGTDPDCSQITVRRGPQFADLLSPDPTANVKSSVPAEYRKLRAIQLKEPSLQFGRGTDEHPLRGMLDHGPVEVRLPRLDSLPLRLAVCSPASADRSVEELLREVIDGHTSIETRDDYLIQYPGFTRAFGLDLRVGTMSGGGWVRYDEELPDGTSLFRQEQALSRICESIATASKASASVVLVVIPVGWEDVERVECGGTVRDLHDLIKAYAAPHGIRTQLLKQMTMEKMQRLEVVWWLSLALYAKSNRTPWTLNAHDDGTVHIGIGYGIDLSDTRKPIVMCCSHIYQANGLGLRFQLSEIGSPASVRRKNPFLKRDDAFRVGERALQAVFESRHGMPHRVCVSKRTPFTRAEQEGFCSALERVPEVELLTLEIEDGARLVRADKEGTSADGFPVRRGTVVPYGSHEALVWIHGDTTGISSKFGGAHYYQGKSRIPAPLRVTRYCGSAPLEEVVTDLLGLSKMDWNSFDLYGKMPVHLSSPGRIARVARLMGSIRLEDRDYRLFM